MKEIKNKLKREIGVLGLSANIVNVVIGAGIFVLPAIVAADLGSASILAYLFCGLLITLVMLCFAEVGSKITDTGGAYSYIEKTFGEMPGFVTAVLFVIASITADAAVSQSLEYGCGKPRGFGPVSLLTAGRIPLGRRCCQYTPSGAACCRNEWCRPWFPCDGGSTPVSRRTGKRLGGDSHPGSVGQDTPRLQPDCVFWPLGDGKIAFSAGACRLV